ncbi:LLM class flavin-dependent oxidoreductase [Chryseosolibacter indicus]|uniref:LLM class flavin-dependent oxidoreductase n=1 Tax=Chryseosolibacter indicus TaxID=2782351 RepID=A0ABS5VP69_9BACT|nr:LLM class flavin-dependent oxidoreductase [Chryseosolibacter indicus]MBT1703242.1 LLM class flavin-dependent oxidoreductase [Chryseosolibacter indicus]
MKLSVLDQTPIRRGSNAREALQESVELVKLAESLNYTRYWISEHHNIGTLACAAPEVLIARLGAETKRIRLGSGGIMLPNHSALKVAENFRLLEGLFPGRIDLGIGRAPGGDRLTASVLNPSNNFEPNEYIQQIRALKAFFADDATPGTVHEKVKAIPKIDTTPNLWMLTSSGESAFLAAHFGIALSFAQFINPVGGAEAIEQYRKNFKTSAELSSPQDSVGIFVFCGETEEKAARMQAVMDYRLLSIARGQMDETPSYESIKSYQYSSDELRYIQYNRQRMVVGTPDVVKKQLEDLAENMDVSEIVVATFAETSEDRLRSYALLAEMFDLQKATQEALNAEA